MATVFQRAGSKTWVAAFKAWDIAKGKFVWRQQATGTTDKGIASGIAATLERGSGEAKAGTLSRAKALEMVNDIMRLAGLGGVAPSPPLREIAQSLLDEAGTVAQTTARKYKAQWSALCAWAGSKADAGCDTWTTADVASYYKATREKFSTTTANDHLRFVAMLFNRAQQLGHIGSNPARLVKRLDNDSVEKEVITRAQVAAMLRVMRKNKARAWIALLGLGWHTGHRIQDLLDVVPADLTHDQTNGWLLSLAPAKKRTRGGRGVVLPIPAWLASIINRLGGLTSINEGSNRNGRVSEQFLVWMRAAGIDPLPVKRGARVVHLRSFHSLRHSMASRLAAAGISGELARLVTDHDSPKVQRKYVHAEVSALKLALAAARRK